jgi:hypothetical protein
MSKKITNDEIDSGDLTDLQSTTSFATTQNNATPTCQAYYASRKNITYLNQPSASTVLLPTSAAEDPSIEPNVWLETRLWDHSKPDQPLMPVPSQEWNIVQCEDGLSSTMTMTAEPSDLIWLSNEPQASWGAQASLSSESRLSLAKIGALHTPPFSNGLFGARLPQCFEHGCDGRTFSCPENYRRHIRERERFPDALCAYCLKSFTRKSNRDSHLSKGRCKMQGKH